MTIIIPDTNFFIQYRDIREIDWQKEFDDEKEITLLIASVVIEELDKFKHDGNTRRARRAKKINTLIRSVMNAPGEILTMKETGCAMTIRLFPYSQDELDKLDAPDWLNKSRPDDQLLLEILKYRNKYPKEKLFFITSDVNPLRKAKELAIDCWQPPESWLMPPEKDLKDKQIAQLEKQVKELQNIFPQIAVTVRDADEKPIEKLEVEVQQFSDLNENDMEEIINVIKKHKPMQTKLPEPSAVDLIFGSVRPPSQKQIEHYQNVEYPNWLESLKSCIQSLPRKLEDRSLTNTVVFWIENTGNTVAENTLVEFFALGDIFFKQPLYEDNEENNSLFPPPPIPPQYKRNSLLEITSSACLDKPIKNFSLLNVHDLKIQRDNNAFYWKNKPNSDAHEWAFECREFRHKTQRESFEINVSTIKRSNKDCSGAIRCVVSAKNLPQPVIKHIKLKTSITTINSRDKILELVAKELTIKTKKTV